MKYVMASLTIGACLLLPSAEAVFAAQPNASCGSPTAGFAPGNSTGAINPAGTNGSPFAADFTQINSLPTSFVKAYAGNMGNPTGPGGGAKNSPYAVSQYDISCAKVSAKIQGTKTPLQLP